MGSKAESRSQSQSEGAEVPGWRPGKGERENSQVVGELVGQEGPVVNERSGTKQKM